MSNFQQRGADCFFRGERVLRGKRVAVLGLARTGVACIRFLVAEGARVTALDALPWERLTAEAQEALELAERWAAPYAGPEDLLPADMLVVSPGVPTAVPLVQEARAAGVDVLGEMELAYRFANVPLVAVTGTCGKGTVVTTLGALLEAGGVRHVVAGNIGLPLISQVEGSAALDTLVAEVSSFQLETTVHFRPHIAALLNISDDHLERYADFDAYAAAKARVFMNQRSTDWAILCVDDPAVAAVEGAVPSRCLRVSTRDSAAHGRLEGDALVVELPGGPAEAVARCSDLVLGGEHHLRNALVAAVAARLCGVHPEAMPAALQGYRPAPHLLELVAEVDGVRYVDDSKATNPASAVADLSGIEGPLVVIAGGKEKQTDFAEFGALLAARCRRVVLVGGCAGRIERAAGRAGLCVGAADMGEAVALAAGVAEPGDTVILCPACSSLDMFQSYAHRGEAFAEAVMRTTGQDRQGE